MCRKHGFVGIERKRLRISQRGRSRSVHLYGRRYLRLFYFDYAADSVAIDTRKPVSRVPFFKGERARGGLHIENERVGTLYLRFHFH
jgi:hypothetical protein